MRGFEELRASKRRQEQSRSDLVREVRRTAQDVADLIAEPFESETLFYSVTMRGDGSLAVVVEDPGKGDKTEHHDWDYQTCKEFVEAVNRGLLADIGKIIAGMVEEDETLTGSVKRQEPEKERSVAIPMSSLPAKLPKGGRCPACKATFTPEEIRDMGAIPDKCPKCQNPGRLVPDSFTVKSKNQTITIGSFESATAVEATNQLE